MENNAPWVVKQIKNYKQKTRFLYRKTLEPFLIQASKVFSRVEFPSYPNQILGMAQVPDKAEEEIKTEKMNLDQYIMLKKNVKV